MELGDDRIALVTCPHGFGVGEKERKCNESEEVSLGASCWHIGRGKLEARSRTEPERSFRAAFLE